MRGYAATKSSIPQTRFVIPASVAVAYCLMVRVLPLLAEGVRQPGHAVGVTPDRFWYARGRGAQPFDDNVRGRQVAPAKGEVQNQLVIALDGETPVIRERYLDWIGVPVSPASLRGPSPPRTVSY